MDYFWLYIDPKRHTAIASGFHIFWVEKKRIQNDRHFQYVLKRLTQSNLAQINDENKNKLWKLAIH